MHHFQQVDLLLRDFVGYYEVLRAFAWFGWVSRGFAGFFCFRRLEIYLFALN